MSKSLFLQMRKELYVDMMPNRESVEALVQQYYKLVFHTIYGLTNNWEESQDLTQDTFHQAMKGMDAAKANSGAQFNAKAWLLRIALNTVRMQRRRKAIFSFIPFSHMLEKRSDVYEQSESEFDTFNTQAAPVQPGGYGTHDDGDLAERIAEQEAVQRTMARLPENMRTCLLLSIIGGLSNTEIATMLNMKEDAVRQRLSRARQQFQKVYYQESGETLIDQPTSDNSHTRQGGKKRASAKSPSESKHRMTLMTQPPHIGSSYG